MILVWHTTAEMLGLLKSGDLRSNNLFSKQQLFEQIIL